MDILSNALQCVDRLTLEKFRLVCTQWNSLISLHPASFKQCYHFKELSIEYPFLQSSNDQEQQVKKWTDLPYFNSNKCCRDDLKDMARSLIGTLLTSEYDDVAVFRVKLTLLHDNSLLPPPIIQLDFPNQFTFLTAFHYLHMLKHLDGCFIDKVHIGQLIQVHPLLSSTINCQRLSIQDMSHLPPLLLTPSLFKPRGLVELWVNIDELEQSIGTINPVTAATTIQMCPMALRMWCCDGAQQLRSTIEFFKTRDVTSIGVKLVKIQVPFSGGHEDKREFVVHSDIHQVTGKPYMVVASIRREKKMKLVTIIFNMEAKKEEKGVIVSSVN